MATQPIETQQTTTDTQTMEQFAKSLNRPVKYDINTIRQMINDKL